MKAAVIEKAGGDFIIKEVDKPSPSENEVLIKVEACGICHSDNFVKAGGFPGLEYPRIPGHEVVGIVEEVGKNVSNWEKGQRVGVGWHGVVLNVNPAAGEILLIARTERSVEFPTMVVMRNT